MKEKFFNSHAALEISSLGNGSEDETDDSNNHSKPRSPFKGVSLPKEEKTGRFHVSKTVLEPTKETEPAVDLKTSPSPPDVAVSESKSETSPNGSKTADDLDSEEINDIAKRKTIERLAQIEERITKEIQEKIGQLKQQQVSFSDFYSLIKYQPHKERGYILLSSYLKTCIRYRRSNIKFCITDPKLHLSILFLDRETCDTLRWIVGQARSRKSKNYWRTWLAASRDEIDFGERAVGQRAGAPVRLWVLKIMIRVCVCVLEFGNSACVPKVPLRWPMWRVRSQLSPF